MPKHQSKRHCSLVFFLTLSVFTLIHIFAIVHNLSKSTSFESSSSSSIIQEDDHITALDAYNHDNFNKYYSKSIKIKNAGESQSNKDNTGLGSVSWKAKIAYVVSLTSCTSNNYDQKFIDGAAVLKHSIYLSSIHNPKSNSKYSYHMIAIIHPKALDCSQNFTRLGYEVLIRETPINVTQIKGTFLRERIVKTGCCQEKELIKLWAYTLTDYPVVVHLDLDTLILQPLDELLDAMIDGPSEKSMNNIPIMKHPNITARTKLPNKINVFFTRDYNIAIPGKRNVGFQGGFFVIRPSQGAFNEYVKLLLEGDFQPYLGWAGKYGGYYGAMQIQGIMSYFYDHFHPDTAVELNRCIYNSMVDNPRSIVGEHKGKCRVGGGIVCEDCRMKNISEIKLIHFTECKKPWDCGVEVEEADRRNEKRSLCNEFHKRWFWIRRELEKSWNYTIHQNNHSNSSKSNWIENNYLGYCTMQGRKGYKLLTLPN